MRYSQSNKEKRRKEKELLLDLHPKVREEVYDVKKRFYDSDGTNLSDRYELILKMTDEQVRGLKGRNALERHQSENGGFMFAFFKSSVKLQERFTSLSPQDIARLMYIGTYAAFESGRLQSDNGKKAYNKKEMGELVGISPKRFNNLFNRYVSEGVIIERVYGQLFINPTVIYRGEVKSLGGLARDLQYTRVFRQTVRDLYKQFNGRKLGQLAIVYSVIPFLNFDSNIICYNPGETVTDLIKPINLKCLAKLLEYENEAKLKTALNAIKLDDTPMFTYVEDPHDRREKRIIVNPRIIFAGNGESLESIKKLFN